MHPAISPRGDSLNQYAGTGVALPSAMNSKYRTSNLPANAQGLAPIDWMLVISITGVLIYLAILTYRASVKDPAMFRRFSQVFGIMACRVGCRTHPVDALESLRWGRRASIKSSRRMQSQATGIANLANDFRHDKGTPAIYTLRGTLLEPSAAFYRGVTAIKTAIRNMLLQRDWIPDRPGMTHCNRGALS